MTNQRKILVLVAMLLAVNLVMGVRWYLATHPATPASTCVSNLRQIVAAKEQWAQAHQETTNQVPTWEDIRPFLAGEIVCPKHGTYTCGRVGDPPTCSLGGREHTLPPN